MKFVVHSHYNNARNPYAVFGQIQTFERGYSPARVDITDSGITFFTIQRVWKSGERITFLQALDRLLKEEFKEGVAAVTGVNSDCVMLGELNALYGAARSLGISTIAGEFRQNGFFDSQVDPNNVTHRFEKYLTADILTGILKPQAADRTEPEEGWTPLKIRLNEIYVAAAREALPDALEYAVSDRPTPSGDRKRSPTPKPR